MVEKKNIRKGDSKAKSSVKQIIALNIKKKRRELNIFITTFFVLQAKQKDSIRVYFLLTS